MTPRKETPNNFYWTSTLQRSRKYHVLICAKCGAHIWTSSDKGKRYVCISCRRAMGLVVNNREGAYTTLDIIPHQILSVGKCTRCQRCGQSLANGLCECCRFYALGDVDPYKSENGRKGRRGNAEKIK